MRRRVYNWWLLQKLSWRALSVAPDVMAKSLVAASLEHKGSVEVDDEDLIRQAFQDKLNGKSNSQSAAMRELRRRHNL